jgi:hypothetical protein
MRIRYFAYPVEPGDLDDARGNPFCHLGVDPYAGRDPTGLDPEVLYLDRYWRYLQALLASPPAHPSRPAYTLVAGDVVRLGDRWVPHVEVLAPAQVGDAARDLDSVSPSEIDAFLESLPSENGLKAEGASCTPRCLRDARRFTARLAGDGRGLIYLIG